MNRYFWILGGFVSLVEYLAADGEACIIRLEADRFRPLDEIRGVGRGNLLSALRADLVDEVVERVAEGGDLVLAGDQPVARRLVAVAGRAADLLRVVCENVPGDRLGDVLRAGWDLDRRSGPAGAPLDIDDVRKLNVQLGEVNLTDVRPKLGDLITRLRHAGIAVSDRRAVKLQRLVAASALLSGRRHGGGCA